MKIQLKLSLIIISSFVLLFNTSNGQTSDLNNIDLDDFTDVYWVGHINPDSDSICSAIGASFLYGGTPTRTGEMNKESKFILEYFNVETPTLIINYSGKKIGIVDFNQQTQLQKTIEMKNIIIIIDHHSLGDKAFSIPQPIRIDIRPWGSVASIIANEIIISKREIPPNIAGVLMSAILSDTLLFTSPTTTNKDKELVDDLAQIAEIKDIYSYGMKMLEAKSDLKDIESKDIITMDFKSFEINGQNVAFGVAETVSSDLLINRKESLLEGMQITKNNADIDYLFFAIVDIIKNESYLLILSNNEEKLAQQSYNRKSNNDIIVLPNMVSRKKDFMPPIKMALGNP